MKDSELTPAQLLQKFHKELQRKHQWRSVRHTWYKDGVRYILGIRERDGIAELLRTIDDVDEIVYESSTLNNLIRAEIHSIIFEPKNVWEDPAWWKVYSVTFIQGDTWLYLLHNNQSELKSKPCQVILRTGIECRILCSVGTKKEATRIYNQEVKRWKGSKK